MRIFKCYGEKLLEKELKASYSFFLKEANLEINSPGYGLVRDKTGLHQDIASIASTGYALAALAIGVKRKWISYQKAYQRTKKTLDTFLHQLENVHGFYYHFVNMNTAKREWNCEVSIIDTAIFICGALFVGEYFGGEIQKQANELYRRVDWQWYRNPDTNQFYMGYHPETGFSGAWDMYAEQLMLYVLGVASPTYPVPKSMYHAIIKETRDYDGIQDIIYTYCGTLFTYQFSHAWIDFKGKEDEDGIDWFENSIKATKANQKYCINQQHRFKTFGQNAWGLTACVGPNGYSGGYGAEPAKAKLDNENDGTVAPCGAAGSVVFTPKESIKALEHFYNNYPKLYSAYGLKDGYNLEKDKPWYAEEYIGIDKGITVLMIENYFSGFIWRMFMKNKYIKQGLELLGIHKKELKKEIVKE